MCQRLTKAGLALGLVLAACGTDPDDSAEACAEAGGVWIPAFAEGGHLCSLPASDGGKPCRSGRDCEGYCAVDSYDAAPDTWRCSPYLLPIDTQDGCYWVGDDEVGITKFCW